MDLYGDLQSDIHLLNKKIEELQQYGYKKADAEENYRVALATFIGERLLQGDKVSVLGDLARGQKNIANLRKIRDKWTILYDATLESIYALKTQIRITETQLKLEWSGSDN